MQVFIPDMLFTHRGIESLPLHIVIVTVLSANSPATNLSLLLSTRPLSSCVTNLVGVCFAASHRINSVNAED